jgi:hypothetical protein
MTRRLLMALLSAIAVLAVSSVSSAQAEAISVRAAPKAHMARGGVPFEVQQAANNYAEHTFCPRKFPDKCVKGWAENGHPVRQPKMGGGTFRAFKFRILAEGHRKHLVCVRRKLRARYGELERAVGKKTFNRRGVPVDALIAQVPVLIPVPVPPAQVHVRREGDPC